MFQFVEVNIDLETDLPVGKEHMAHILAVGFVLPLLLVALRGAAPAVVLGEAQGVGQVFRPSRQFVGSLVAGEVGGVVPESATLSAVVALPVGIDAFYHFDSLACPVALQLSGLGRQVLGSCHSG